MQNSKLKIQNCGNSFVLNFKFLTLNSRKGGFTLLELMISVAMIGIIVLVIGGAMRLGFSSVNAGEKKIEYLERIRASLNIIDSQIQSEIPLTYDDLGARKYYFKGDRESMEFPTNSSVWSGQRGYVMANYRVESDSQDKKSLTVSENTIGIDTIRAAKLLDSFDEIYFEYFYKDPTEEKGKWIEQWTDDATMPEKVKVHLVKGETDLSFISPMRAGGTSKQDVSDFGPNIGK